jgi:hypothetical protein
LRGLEEWLAIQNCVRDELEPPSVVMISNELARASK